MPTHKQRAEPEKLVGFRVGDVAYAVPIQSVKEIVNPQPLSELPHCPRSVAGVVDHRGEVVPILDLRARFGVEPGGDVARTKWILVDLEGRTIGLRVDQVTEVFPADEGGLRPPPDLGGGEDERGIAGVTTYLGKMVFVLGLDSFRELARGFEEPPVDRGSRELA